MGDGIHMPTLWCDCSAFCGLGGDGVRIFVYFDYTEYHSIRKWMQRHPEYDGSVFSNDGFYIAKFDIDATDPQKVAYFFHYFMGKHAVLFKMREISPHKVLSNFTILSYRPFEAVAKQTNHDEISSHTVLPEGGPASPPSHDERTPPEFHLATSGNMAEQTKEGEVAVSSPSGSSGDTYEYYPRHGRDYE